MTPKMIDAERFYRGLPIRTYAELTAPTIPASQEMQARIAQLRKGEVLTSRKFGVSLKSLSNDRVRDNIHGSKLFQGVWINPGEIPSTYVGLHLDVHSYVDVFRGIRKKIERRNRYPFLNMTVLGDAAQKTLGLYDDGIEVWAKIGRSTLELNYQQAGSTRIARLASVRRLIEEGMTGIYYEGRYLNPTEVEQLQLGNKGFPKQVDWVNTLLMYATQTRPDQTGEFVGTPLTADDINREPLIAAA